MAERRDKFACRASAGKHRRASWICSPHGLWAYCTVVLCWALLHGASGSTELSPALGSSFATNDKSEAYESVFLPKNIYTFWEGSQPELVQQSLDTWQRQSPTWDVHLINKSNLQEYISVDSLPSGWTALDVLQLSDLVRLEVVAERGGVWLDATIALTQPLETWVQETGTPSGLIGFELDFALEQAKEFNPSAEDWAEHFFANGSLRPLRQPLQDQPLIFESWGFAAPQGCIALRLWRDEFRRAVSFDGGPTAYCEALVEDPASDDFLPQSLRRWLPYLTIHATLARVRHMNPAAFVYALRAESSAFMHLQYVVSWTMARIQHPTNYIADGTGGAVIALARGKLERPPPPQVGPLMKFRNLDRTAFACLLAYGAYATDSPLAAVFELKQLPRMWPVRQVRLLAAFEARFGATDDILLICFFTAIRIPVHVAQWVIGMFEEYLFLWAFLFLDVVVAANLIRWKWRRGQWLACKQLLDGDGSRFAYVRRAISRFRCIACQRCARDPNAIGLDTCRWSAMGSPVKQL